MSSNTGLDDISVNWSKKPASRAQRNKELII